ncbi:MAG: hypothetical protein GXY77_06070 [Fibrobacter sp.]|nr:hypothetical protein [Fibrobacter sp.]
MFRNFHFQVTIILLLNVYLISGKPVEFNDIQLTRDSFSAGFDLAQQSQNEQSFYFAFSSDPSNNFSCEIILTDSSKSVTAPCKYLANGWSGKDYLQWCSFESTNLKTNGNIKGTITVTFFNDIFHTVNSDDISIRNGIIRIPIQRPLKKSQFDDLPQYPFNTGIKIEVDRDGIYEIKASELKALGVPVNSTPSRSYRLYEKNRQIPLYIQGSGKKTLSSDDRILFYGQYLRGSQNHYEQFSNTNVYWLTWDNNEIGARVTEVSGERIKDPTLYSSNLVIAQSFPDTVHFEEDNDIRWLGNITDQTPEYITDSPENTDSEDNWYWGIIGNNELTDFSISVPAPASDGYARLKISLMGLTSTNTVKPDHILEILLNQDSPGKINQIKWDGQSRYIFYSDTFHVKGLKENDNRISFLCPQNRGYFDRSALNWVELEYPRGYHALDDQIKFKNPPDTKYSVVEYGISGFSSDKIELWDIKRNRFFTKFLTEKGTGQQSSTYTLVFQDSLAVNTTYLAQAVSKRLNPAGMKPDTIISNWNHVLNSDYIAISVDSFSTELKVLLETHTKRGLKTAFVDIDDIYNSFSWGIRDPESIRSFLAYLFNNGNNPPRYLLLGGDTSHDLDKKNRSRNIVPTKLSRFPGWGPGANDCYFTMVCGKDNFMDLAVGRFPAQNRLEMRTLVNKTVNYINNLQRGFWRDNILLLGGGEQKFTEFNTEVVNNQIGSSMNIYRLDADPGSRYYKDEFTASKQIADYINSGVYIVNFNGHGGGNIWSDNNFFGYKDLSRLYNGQWGKSGKLPAIFSFTCLTGFFESVFYRSLGEEFIRTDENGAVCFYGASAYTSSSGNLLLNKLILQNAIHGDFESTGDLIKFCETSMLVRHGEHYLDLVRQYNLLGDPALPWIMTPDTLALTLANSSLTPGDSLSVSGICSPVTNGTLRVIVKSGDEIWNQVVDSITDSTFSYNFAVKDSAQTASGLVRAYAWNDSTEIRGWIPFSKDSLMIFDTHLSLSKASFGDSVFIKCRLSSDSSFEFTEIYCNYAISSSWRPEIDFTGIKMVNDSLDYWSSSEKVFLGYNGDITEKLLVRFRLLSNKESKESALFSFDLTGRPDLTFIDTTLNLFWKRDSLRCRCSIINIGNLKAPGCKVLFFFEKDKLVQDTIIILNSRNSLEPGKTLTLDFALPDTQGVIGFGGWIDPDNKTKEILHENNTVYGKSVVVYKDLKLTSDTLESFNGGFSLSPSQDFDQKYRVFLFEKSLQQKSPLKTESNWLPLQNGSSRQFITGIRPALKTSDSLFWKFIPQIAESGLETKNDYTSRIAIMYYDTTISSWRSLSTGNMGGSLYSIKTSLPGPFALAKLGDLDPPDITVSVADQVLNTLDYAARNKPFTLFFSDPSGVLPSSINMFINRKELQSDLHSQIECANDLGNITITAYPQTENSIDSLTVTASDLAGNSISRTFEYMPGEDLSVRFLSCHPNPFTAKTRIDGTIQVIRFAYLLTDLADKVKLSIYTVSGKRIRQWSFFNIIGYQEVKWDGRDNDGYRIANGTYYAKLEASNRRQKTKKIIRIAKLEGY